MELRWVVASPVLFPCVSPAAPPRAHGIKGLTAVSKMRFYGAMHATHPTSATKSARTRKRKNVTLASGKPRTAPEPTALRLEFVHASENWEGERQSEARRQLAEREQLVREAEAALGEKAAAQKREAEASRRVVRRTLIGAVASLMLAVLAGGFGYYAYLQQGEAEEQAHKAQFALVEADRNAQRADKEQWAAIQTRNDALLSESKHLADRARQILEVDKDPGTALLLALEAFPDQASDDSITRNRPYWPPAEASLEAARRMVRELVTLKGHTGSVDSVAMTPDGARIVTGSADNTVRVWDAKTFAELATLKGHTDNVWSVAVTPDGARIVTGSRDNTARIWDASTFAELATIKGHTETVTSVTVTPDGARVVTGSADNTARVWEPGSGAGPSANEWREIGQLKGGHTRGVTSVAVTPDGARIVTASDDNTARVWESGSGAGPSANEWREIGQLKGLPEGSGAWR